MRIKEYEPKEQVVHIRRQNVNYSKTGMELKSGVVKNGLLRVQLFILMNANFNVYVKFWFSYIFSAAIVIFHIIIYIFVRPIQFFSVSYLLNMNGCVENSTDVSALNFILYKRTDFYP